MLTEGFGFEAEAEATEVIKVMLMVKRTKEKHWEGVET